MAYPEAEIQKGIIDYTKSDGRKGTCRGIDGAGNFYLSFQGTELNSATEKPYIESEKIYPAEWGIYTPKTGDYVPCVILPKGHQIGGIVVSNQCVLWFEDENSNFTWLKTQWNIYNKKTQKDAIFYNPSRNQQ